MSSSRKVAEQFIKDQVKIMRQFGKAPKLSAKRYKEVVTDTQRSFESLRPQENSVRPERKKGRASGASA
jgi:hypothetical protein